MAFDGKRSGRRLEREGGRRAAGRRAAPAALALAASAALVGCQSLSDAFARVTFGCPWGTEWIRSVDSGTPGLRKLEERYCVYVDEKGEKVRHGPYAELYEKGTKSEAGAYDHGKRTGTWESFFPSGKPRAVTTYVEGNPGTFVAWHSNGAVWERGSFVRGRKQGVWTGWYANGHKSYQANYDDGVLSSDWATWHDNGQKSEQGQYVKGVREGLWTRWHPNGVKSWELVFAHGQPNSVYKAWHENGQQSEQATFVHGSPVGAYTTWHDNGRKQEEGAYERGMLNGRVTLWDRDGKIWSEIDLLDGEFVDGYGLAGRPSPPGGGPGEMPGGSPAAPQGAG